MRSQCSTFAVCARAISYCFVKASWHRRDRSHGRRSSQQFPSDYLPSVSTGPSSQWLDRPCTAGMVFPTSQDSSQAGRCCLLFHGTHQSEQATDFFGRLCGCNDSSHMAPAFRPSSTIKRAISACAGGFASIVLQLTSVNTCRRPCPCDSEGVYRHDIVVRDSPWALFGPGVGLAQDLSVEQMPVMDMQLADKAERLSSCTSCDTGEPRPSTDCGRSASLQADT